MNSRPGTEDATHIGFHIADRLLRLLVAKGVLSGADAAGMLDELAADLEADHRVVAKRCAPTVREMAADMRAVRRGILAG